MSPAAAVGVIVAVAVVLSLALTPADRRPAGGRRTARALRIIAGVVTLAVAAVLVRPAWQDSGAFALVLVGVPVVPATIVLALTLTGRRATLATWVAAAVALGWGLLTSLGLGLYLLGPAVLMLVAAVAAGRDRPATAVPTR